MPTASRVEISSPRRPVNPTEATAARRARLPRPWCRRWLPVPTAAVRPAAERYRCRRLPLACSGAPANSTSAPRIAPAGPRHAHLRRRLPMRWVGPATVAADVGICARGSGRRPQGQLGSGGDAADQGSVARAPARKTGSQGERRIEADAIQAIGQRVKGFGLIRQPAIAHADAAHLDLDDVIRAIVDDVAADAQPSHPWDTARPPGSKSSRVSTGPSPSIHGAVGAGSDLHAARLQVAQAHVRLGAVQHHMVAGQVIAVDHRHPHVGQPVRQSGHGGRQAAPGQAPGLQGQGASLTSATDWAAAACCPARRRSPRWTCSLSSWT